MGRWGWSLFDSELDMDLYSDVVEEIVSSCANRNINEDNASHESEDSYIPDEEKINNPEIREVLDAYLCDKLFKTSREKNDDPENVILGSQLNTIFLGVAMMEAGATISKDNLEYLRSIARAYGPS